LIKEVGGNVVDDDEACGEVVGDNGGVKVGGRKWESG